MSTITTDPRPQLAVGAGILVLLATVAACVQPPRVVIENHIENSDVNANANTSDNANTNINDNSGCCDCCDCDCDCEDDGCDDDTGDTGDPVDTCECPDGYEPTPAGDACVKTETYEATFTGKEYEVCPGNTDSVYGKFGAKFPGGTAEQNTWWGQDDGTINGRLNEIGVWACDASTGAAGTEPTEEWIGFSTCLDITEPGDYLVGIAADNRVRFFVDGNLEFERNTYDTAHFNYWYVQPISLTSGSHIIEMFGYNDGDIAAFGAEIYGPFPTGSLSTDADMMAADTQGNIVWSTGDRLGTTFDLGDETGWVCPDGTAFDTCAAEPVCTEVDLVPCDGDPPLDDGGDTDTGDPTDGEEEDPADESPI